jgi:hypothetical protein
MSKSLTYSKVKSLKTPLSGQLTADLTSSGPPKVTLIYNFLLHNKSPSCPPSPRTGKTRFTPLVADFELSV